MPKFSCTLLPGDGQAEVDPVVNDHRNLHSQSPDAGRDRCPLRRKQVHCGLSRNPTSTVHKYPRVSWVSAEDWIQLVHLAVIRTMLALYGLPRVDAAPHD